MDVILKKKNQLTYTHSHSILGVQNLVSNKFAAYSAKKKKTCLQPSIKITNKKITIILVRCILI